MVGVVLGSSCCVWWPVEASSVNCACVFAACGEWRRPWGMNGCGTVGWLLVLDGLSVGFSDLCVTVRVCELWYRERGGECLRVSEGLWLCELLLVTLLVFFSLWITQLFCYGEYWIVWTLEWIPELFFCGEYFVNYCKSVSLWHCDSVICILWECELVSYWFSDCVMYSCECVMCVSVWYCNFCPIFFLSQPDRVFGSDRVMIRSGWDNFTRSGFVHHPIWSELEIFRIGSGWIGSGRIFCPPLNKTFKD